MTWLPEHPPSNDDAAGDLTVVHFAGPKTSLDEETVDRIRDQLLALADEASASDLLLDFGNVDYVSTMALGTLVTLHKKLLTSGRHMSVRNLSPEVQEVFAATRLDKFLDLRPAGQEAELAAEDGPAGSPIGVLVADDELAVRCVLAIGLRQQGFKVWLASHGQQAVELYRRYQKEIAVVLLDVVMPGMDGPHTLLALQEIYADVRCCFMTGNPRNYADKALLLLGAVRVFQKPFALAEVIHVLNRLASRSPRPRQDRWIETSVERSVHDVGVESQAR